MDRIRILMAEADEDARAALASAFAAGGPEVAIEVATSGAEALRRIREAGADGFEAILVGVALPDAQIADIVRAMAREAGEQPIFVVTRDRPHSRVLRGIGNGRFECVPWVEAIQDDALGRRVRRAVAACRRRSAARRRVRCRLGAPSSPDRDSLTGLWNREYLERVLNSASRFGGRGETSIVLVGVDAGRTCGGQGGAPVEKRGIIAVARRLRETSNGEALLGRWGEAELAAVASGVTLGQAVLWAERFLVDLDSIPCEADVRVDIGSVSIGIAGAANRRLGMETAAQAEAALALARRTGAVRLCTWSRVVFERAAQRMEGDRASSPEGRLRGVLLSCRRELGATQYEHLTEHAEYVSRMAVRIGRVLRMEADSLRHLRLAGLYHDLGKLLIPEDVLAKPAALSLDERRLLDRHPDTGAAMSRRLGLDEEAAAYIRYHHKAFRTAGGNPPLGARVLAVADAFVTMTSERPYRSARSLSSAVSELRRCRGEQFDPDVVDAVPRALLDGVPVPAS